MTHDLQPACLWLEFGGNEDYRSVSNPYAYIRLVDSRIEGGDRREYIGSLDHDHWTLANQGGKRYSRVSGLGVFFVRLELPDGSDVQLECMRMSIDGPLLLVDGQAQARFDQVRGTWTRLGCDSQLRSIRLEPEGVASLSMMSSQDDAYAGAYSRL